MQPTVDYYLAPVSPWTYLGHDRFVALFLMPLAATALVLTTCLQVVAHKSWLKAAVLESDWAGLLGKLSFAIYLLHETIGDFYLQMGVKGHFKQWGSLLAPPGVSWTVSNEACRCAPNDHRLVVPSRRSNSTRCTTDPHN